MISVSVVHVLAGVVVALFVLQVVRHFAAQSSNPIAVGVADGISFLTAP